MNDTIFLVQGRSIDGTVYWAIDGWGDRLFARFIHSRRAAELAIEFLKEDMQPRHLDDTIGQLRVVEASRSALNDELARYYTEMEGEDF